MLWTLSSEYYQGNAFHLNSEEASCNVLKENPHISKAMAAPYCRGGSRRPPSGRSDVSKAVKPWQHRHPCDCRNFYHLSITYYVQDPIVGSLDGFLPLTQTLLPISSYYPISLLSQLFFRAIKWLAHSHLASKWKNWDLTLDCHRLFPQLPIVSASLPLAINP